MPSKNITNNSAPIFSADLLYEQNGKCGQTVVLGAGETWSAGTGAKAWKFVVLQDSTLFSDMQATNIHGSDLTQLTGISWSKGQEVMLNFTSLGIEEGLIIVYMDCLQS
jgi:hypothetical protein|tara:strand:+ start:315 stop:641 length:327 start_codon:yes stop_codon:yes gene_type:complete